MGFRVVSLVVVMVVNLHGVWYRCAGVEECTEVAVNNILENVVILVGVS